MKTEPTDDQIRVAIALGLGWRWEGPFNKKTQKNRLIGPNLEVVTVWRDGMIGGTDLPDYLTSLDAMHEAEKVLTMPQRHDYGERLARLCQQPEIDSMKKVGLRRKSNDKLFFPNGFGWFDIAHLTARQRALAFLATIKPQEKE